MLKTLKKILSKLFPKKLATETTAQVPNDEIAPWTKAEIESPAPVSKPVLLIEPAPEQVQTVEELVAPEPKVKSKVSTKKVVKKKPTSSKKKKKL